MTELFIRCVWSHMLTDKYVNQVNKSDLSAQRVVTSVTAQAVSLEKMLNKIQISKSHVLNQISANNKNSTNFSKFLSI